MSAPIATGPVRSNISIAGQAPQSVGRTGIAKLRKQRRIQQFGEERASADRGESRLRPADRLPAADRHGAHGRLIALHGSGEPDVDRLGREHQPCAAETANPEVGAAAAIALPRVIDAAGGNAAEVEVGPADIEDLERHCL